MLWQAEAPGATLTLEGRVVDPVEGIDACLRVEVVDGRIASLEPGGDDATVLCPAFVDPHVHLRTPGREDEETIASGTAAAAAGGYCAVVAMPNTDPVVDSVAVLGALIELAREEAVVPTGFAAAITKGQRGEELTEMAALAAMGAVCFTDDGRPVASAGVVRNALAYAAVAGRPLALHEEEQTLSRDGQMHEGAISAELGLAGWPSLAESVMIERDLALAAYERQHVHIMHVSAAESVSAIRAAKERGVRVTAEVTPHHLCLTDEAVRSLDPNVKMNPPLRTEHDRAALLDGLRDGTLDCVATDHAPHARHEKEVPFEEAPFGVIGLETAFAALHTTLVAPGLLPLDALVERMSAAPARALGLPVPRIRVGEQANVAQLALDRQWEVRVEGIRSRSVNSWLLGRRLRGVVLRTIAGGRLVHDLAAAPVAA
jgi:dihydroorotase